jgi:hypothetical protein
MNIPGALLRPSPLPPRRGDDRALLGAVRGERPPRMRPRYTEEERLSAQSGDLQGLRLPRTLLLFAARMSARYIGPPVYDPYFNVFALPLVASLSDVAAKWVSARELDEAA